MLQPFSDDNPQHFFKAAADFLGEAAHGFFMSSPNVRAEEGTEILILVATRTQRRRTTAAKAPICCWIVGRVTVASVLWGTLGGGARGHQA